MKWDNATCFDDCQNFLTPRDKSITRKGYSYKYNKNMFMPSGYVILPVYLARAEYSEL